MKTTMNIVLKNFLNVASASDTSVVVDDGVSLDMNSVYLYPSRNSKC